MNTPVWSRFSKTSDTLQHFYPRFSVYIGHPLTKTAEKLRAHDKMVTGTLPANRLLIICVFL